MRLRETTLRNKTISNKYEIPINEYWLGPNEKLTRIIEAAEIRYSNEISENPNVMEMIAISHTEV